MSIPVLLSVAVLTYNHGKYIEECLRGICEQQTDFDFEIVIADDHSMDDNVHIIEKTLSENKNKRIVSQNKIFNTSNVGMMNNFIHLLTNCKGKYIAFCEGDDYWTDPYKLQKQVDFLESNPDFSLCFHNALITWEDKNIHDSIFCASNTKEMFFVNDIISKWGIPTASMVFRSYIVDNLPDWMNQVYHGDYALSLLSSHHGKIKYFPQVWSVYRRTFNTDSMTSRFDTLVSNKNMITLFQHFDDFTEQLYHRKIIKRILRLQLSVILLTFKKKNPFFWRYLKLCKNYLLFFRDRA